MTNNTGPAKPTDSASRKFGGQLGPVAYQILQDLRRHGKSNRLDIEMRIGQTKQTVRLKNLATSGHIRRICDSAFTGFEISNKGRAAIGVTIPETNDRKPELRTRICNAAMRSTFNPATDTSMGRIGLAMCR